MEFRLIYKGPLPSAQSGKSRRQEKHAVRKQIHEQLRTLWNVQAPFSRWMTQKVPRQNSSTGIETTVIQQIANNYKRFGFRFVPIVTRGHKLGCKLDILFLRHDEPGAIVKSGGDVDNRLKVLFDALRMPSNQDEVKGVSAAAGEDPFYVLLEDDSLITSVRVTTDRLLVADQNNNDVHLVITVKPVVLIVSPFLSNLEFL